MTHLIEQFVRNPVKVSVGVLLLLLFGVLAMLQMPMQLTPEVQIPTISIETRWPGRSPQDVERRIVLEQEKQLKGVEGVTKMSSESMDSFGRITLEFAVGSDMREALVKVNSRLDQVPDYPEDAREPILRSANLSDRPIAWFILGPRLPEPAEIEAFQARHPELRAALDKVLSAPNEGVGMYRLRKLAEQHAEAKELMPANIDITELRKFCEDIIEARFERVKGVADANVLGGREEEMQVLVKPEQLAARLLTVNELRLALRAQNADTSGGDFWEGKRRYPVRTLGQFRSPEQVANTVIAYHDRAPIYVRDVADVQPGFKKPDGLIRRFGTERIAMNAIRDTGANVMDVMKGLQKATAELNAGILKQRNLQLIQVYDETEYIYSAVDLVTENLLVGAVLTFFTLLLFLRSGRSTIIIFLHILTSTVGAFLAMNVLGRSLNVLALGGLAFAVGMLVDNAIVMLENIYRRHQLGESPLTASVRGANEVWPALLNATLANLAVFLPVLFVREEAGQLFRDIAIAICAAVGLSMLVAVTVVPTAAKRLLREHADASTQTNGEATDGASPTGRLLQSAAATDGQPRSWPKELARTVNRKARTGWEAFKTVLLGPLDALGRGFVRAVVGINAWLQRGVWLRLATVLVFVGASIVLTYLLLPKVEYLPQGNRNLVIAILLPPPGYNINQMLEIGAQLEADLRPYWDTDPDSPEAAQLQYPAIGDYFFVARGRQLFMGIRATDPQRAGELIPLIRETAGRVPGMIVVARQTSLFEQGLTAGRTVDIEIRGPEITKLVAIGGRVMGQVRDVVPGAQAIPQPSLDLSSPEVHVKPKQQATEMGMTAEELGYAVDALVDGAYATDYYVGGDKIDLRIIGQLHIASHTQDIEALPIATRTGELVPLRALADVIISSGPEQINHRERQRAITIQVTPPQQIALEEAMSRIQTQIVDPLIESGELEGGMYQITLGGTADKLHATWQNLRFNILLAVVITYLCMAATFESWLYPLVVILTVPLGAVGGFAGLWLLNLFVFQALDVLTMLGFVMLIGTVVNNPILIVEQALIHMREEGMPMRQAILEGVRTRIRPIFMTTFGGLVGLLPLVVSPGAGSELYRGIGAVLLGGLLLSTVVTLVVVPTLFSLMIEAREGLARLFGRQPPAPAKVEHVAPSTEAALPA